MANFDPNSVNAVIGLWDFIRDAEVVDKDLDDGFAQDGNTLDGNAIVLSYAGDRHIVGAGSNSAPTVFDFDADPNRLADDLVSPKNSFDVGEGATATVENLITSFTQTRASKIKDLFLDLTDDDILKIAFCARSNSGQERKYYV